MNMNPQKTTRFSNHDWRWMRIFYFENCKDDLILQGVWPALRNAVTASLAESAFFQRDWIAGPNVLVGFYKLAAPWTELERPVHAYLRSHPSRASFSAEEFRKWNRVNADLELRRTSDANRDPAPNNTILLDSEEPFSPLVSEGLLLHLTRQFLCRSSTIVVDWLELVRSGTWQRQQIALEAMVALIWLANPKTLRSHISYSSHASGFLRFMELRSNVNWREKFSRHYAEAQGQAMRQMLINSIKALHLQQNPMPGMQEYLSLLRETMLEIYTGLSDGRYAPPPVQEIGSGDSQRSGIQVNQRLRQLMQKSTILQTWRIAVNLVYLMLNQLGLPALERYLACYLITRAAEELYAEPVSSIVEELARTGEVGRVISCFEKTECQTAPELGC